MFIEAIEEMAFLSVRKKGRLSLLFYHCRYPNASDLDHIGKLFVEDFFKIHV
jgi:hypothetical protein